MGISWEQAQRLKLEKAFESIYYKVVLIDLITWCPASGRSYAGYIANPMISALYPGTGLQSLNKKGIPSTPTFL
jgi:hypothetical protein